MDRTRLGVALGGGIFVVIGGRIVQTVSGAGGDLVPPILALGGLSLLFGASVVLAAVQTRVAIRRLLAYEIVAGGVGLFAISASVTALTIGGRGPLADFFRLLGAAGMVLGVSLILLVKYNRR